MRQRQAVDTQQRSAKEIIRQREAEKAQQIQDEKERVEQARLHIDALTKQKMDRLREFEERKQEEHEAFLRQQKKEDQRRAEVLHRVSAQDGMFRQHMHEKLAHKVT
jgi:hypothetical protein